MKSVIHSVTVISQPGVKEYRVGEKGIVRIVDESLEFDLNSTTQYSGYNANGSQVFTVQNAPVDVEYIEVPDGHFRTLRRSQLVKISSDAVDQQSQEPLDGKSGVIKRINNEHEIIVQVTIGEFPHCKGRDLPFAVSELKPV